MKKPAFIVDIDGTLADCAHRRHHVENRPKNWPAFFAEAVGDPAKSNVLAAVLYFWRLGMMTPIFVTGRDETQRDLTNRWLTRVGPFAGLELLMRPAGDFRPDFEVKREIFELHIKPRYDVKLALDDRGSVVKMWRSLGIETWQVAEGDF